MVEHFLGKEEVVSSILINSSNIVFGLVGKEEVVSSPDSPDSYRDRDRDFINSSSKVVEFVE